ncbi:glycoside hydrolase family 16 protein [Sunxiuqinia sp. sy24]|uniref:glycoside hydrolase family 16 protein n=1 Tax=Sunxiuqinia sp. sy24 TaxID=3461495 RepID=UPI0040465DE8
MNKIVLLFMVTLVTMACSQNKDQKWELIWSDDFSVDGVPDQSKWSFSGRRSPDWACYCTDQPENAEVIDGVLHLRGIVAGNDADTLAYQTGCIQTKGNFSFQYGKLEVRAKLDQGQGSWPAIWLMPEKSVYGGWPKSGEIDVMEQLNFDTIFYQTIHSDYVDIQQQKNKPKHHATTSYKIGEFNIFGLEWYPDRLDFLINGVKTFTYPKVEGIGSSQWPFDQEFYLILNQALGGNWPGPVNREDLPVEMQVDWVKVYQLN